jgi:hypothetical protein
MASPAAQPGTSSEWPCAPALERAAGYVHAVRTAATPGSKVRAAASKAGMTAVAEVLRTLPRVTAELSGSPAGEELRAWFRPDRRLPFNRAPVAVLDLPASTAEYLAGRRRQALRTNLRRAADAGIACAGVEAQGELHRVTERVTAVRGSTASCLLRPGARPSPSRRFTAAYDRAGDPVGISELVVDGSWAGLVFMVTAVGHAEAPLVRYALHAHMTAALVEQEVATLVVGGSMLLTSPGVRYFQQRSGFRPVWVDAPRG